MSYKISLRIINDNEDDIRVVDKASRAGNAKWGDMKYGYGLRMSSSGNAGALMFQTTWGEKFAVATGVHNYKRWIDINTSVGDQTAEQVLEKYFTSGATEDGNKWKVPSRADAKLSDGKKLNAFFYVDETNDLRAVLAYY